MNEALNKNDDQHAPPDLRTAAQRLDEEKHHDAAWHQNTKTILRGLTVRGEPFGQQDWLILKGEERVIQIPVKDLPVMIGSGKDVGYRVEGEGVSRKHARVSREGLFLLIEDMQSKNGTFLNACRIHAEYLCEGDEISMGAAQFRVARG